MMTLHLKKCVSFFVCLSLLLSACSPGKSHKASEFARITVDDEESAEEIDDHAPHAEDNDDKLPTETKSLFSCFSNKPQSYSATTGILPNHDANWFAKTTQCLEDNGWNDEIFHNRFIRITPKRLIRVTGVVGTCSATGVALGAVTGGIGGAAGFVEFVKEGKELGVIEAAGVGAKMIGVAGLATGVAVVGGVAAGRAAARKFAKGPISAALAGGAAGALAGGLAGAGVGAIGGAITSISWHALHQLPPPLNAGIVCGVAGLLVGGFAGGVEGYDAWYKDEAAKEEHKQPKEPL